MTRRPGFALLAVLWVIAAASALSLGASLVAGRAIGTAQNRANITRATWRAEGCLDVARAVISETLREPETARTGIRHTWSTLDLAVQESRVVSEAGCDLRIVPAGARMDVNSADGEMLRALFAAIGIPGPRSDSLADALLDWRDADDEPRANGAERDWYVLSGADIPRNAPLASMLELSRVRGYAAVAPLDSVLSVEPGRITIERAPLSVIAALPGFGEEALSRAAEMRHGNAPAGDLISFGGTLSPAARASLHARYADLARITVGEPDAWIVTSTATLGSPGVAVAMEVRLARAGDRAAIVRRRTWIE
ncbi:MAG: general secretion pathway protein GspK [Gemmatimonadaceae bacterium]